MSGAVLHEHKGNQLIRFTYSIIEYVNELLSNKARTAAATFLNIMSSSRHFGPNLVLNR